MSMNENRLTIEQLFTDNKNVHTQMILSYEDPGLHSHEFIEFFYVLDGQCIHYLDGKEQTISCGDAFILTPNNSHTFLAIEKTFMHRDIIIQPEYFKKICNNYSPDLYDKFYTGKLRTFTLSNHQLNRIEALTQKLTSIEDSNTAVIDCAICTYIINAFLEHSYNISSNKYPAWISKLLSILSAPENFKTDQQIIINSFSYSQEYVCRTFKKMMGITITDYFNEQKMKYAYSLLRSSSYSIEQICERINFNNTSYFYRLFKKHFGVTPKEVTKQNGRK